MQNKMIDCQRGRAILAQLGDVPLIPKIRDNGDGPSKFKISPHPIVILLSLNM